MGWREALGLEGEGRQESVTRGEWESWNANCEAKKHFRGSAARVMCQR